MNEQSTQEKKDLLAEGTFWDLYIGEHDKRLNRWLHAIGTLLACILFGYTIYSRNWWLLLLVPVVGYGFAWFGHAFIERNKPLSFKFPVRSFFSDFRMAFLMLTGQDPKK